MPQCAVATVNNFNKLTLLSRLVNQTFWKQTLEKEFSLKNKWYHSVCPQQTQKHLSHRVSVMSWNKSFCKWNLSSKHCIQTQTHTLHCSTGCHFLFCAPILLLLVNHLAPLVTVCDAGHKCKCRQTGTRAIWKGDLIPSSSSSLSSYMHIIEG